MAERSDDVDQPLCVVGGHDLRVSCGEIDVCGHDDHEVPCGHDLDALSAESEA